MKTLMNTKPSESPRIPRTVTIGSGQSISEALDLGDMTMIGFRMPADWTTAAINVQVSDDGTTWSPAYDEYGSIVGSIASPVVLGGYGAGINAMYAWQYVRFISGTVASPVNQDAERTIKVISRMVE